MKTNNFIFSVQNALKTQNNCITAEGIADSIWYNRKMFFSDVHNIDQQIMLAACAIARDVPKDRTTNLLTLLNGLQNESAFAGMFLTDVIEAALDLVLFTNKGYRKDIFVKLVANIVINKGCAVAA